MKNFLRTIASWGAPVLFVCCGISCSDAETNTSWPFESGEMGGGNTNRTGGPDISDAVETDGDGASQTWFVRDVGADTQHVCAVLLDHTLRCWGSGLATSSKNGTEELRRANERITPDGAFEEVEVGDGFACGLREDGTLLCWPQIAEYGRRDFEPPVDKADGLEIGSELVCLRLDGGETVKCWNARNKDEKISFGGEPTSFATGGTNACVTYDEPQGPRGHSYKLDCDDTQSGRRYSPPTRVSRYFAEVAVARVRVCGLRDDGRVFCHGWESDDKKMVGWFPERSEYGPYRRLSAAYYIRCGIVEKTDEIECWGDYVTGDIPSDPPELQIPPGPFADIEIGDGDPICGIRPDNELVCFGQNVPERLK